MWVNNCETYADTLSTHKSGVPVFKYSFTSLETSKGFKSTIWNGLWNKYSIVINYILLSIYLCKQRQTYPDRVGSFLGWELFENTIVRIVFPLWVSFFFSTLLDFGSTTSGELKLLDFDGL